MWILHRVDEQPEQKEGHSDGSDGWKEKPQEDHACERGHMQLITCVKEGGVMIDQLVFIFVVHEVDFSG